MLIALFTIFFLAGTPSALLMKISDVQDSIKLVLPNNEERKAALSVMTQMEKHTKAQSKKVDKLSKQLSKGIADHNFNSSEIDQMWNTYHEARENFQNDMINLRFDLKEHVSREEWAKIFSTN